MIGTKVLAWAYEWDPRIQKALGLPRWVSPVGLTIHFFIGLALTLALWHYDAAPPVPAIAAGWGAVAHEIADGDTAKGGNPSGGWPWNGPIDVAAFMPVPLLYLALGGF